MLSNFQNRQTFENCGCTGNRGANLSFSYRSFASVGSWPGAGAAIIEVIASLPTPNLPMSMSGMERAA